jgi:dinuclear metal center YbgI/SA1388 family protein
MQINTLVTTLAEKLNLSFYQQEDSSQNGLQVQPAHPEIKLIALAVDANADTITQAAQAHADLLFVHHGLFWGQNQLITGLHYQRLKTLLTSGVGLYACHLPLDAHPQLGNNAVLADKLALTSRLPLSVGYSGNLPQPLSLNALIHQLGLTNQDHYHLEKFGPSKVKRVGIISGGGGASQYVTAAIEAQCDLYLTGELTHASIQTAREAKINLLGAGHYWSETFGVRAVGQYLQQELSLKTIWLDSPTGF